MRAILLPRFGESKLKMGCGLGGGGGGGEPTLNKLPGGEGSSYGQQSLIKPEQERTVCLPLQNTVGGEHKLNKLTHAHFACETI